MAGTKNKVAGFLRHCDRSSVCYDPHEFGLGLIQAMAFWGENPESEATPLSRTVASQIKVVCQNDRMFPAMQRIWVAAPDSVWDEGELAYECEIGMENLY